MNGTPRDAQVPSHRECLLPSMARTPSVTQVTPAKKITFLKRGDPRFSGVHLAVHQRTFKSFGTLMDELSQRVPLSFGVRSVTTPRGLHALSALEQLEDGGCYLCSDKKPLKASIGPDQPQGSSPSAQQSQEVESQHEASGMSSSWKNLKVPRRIMLVKNGDPRFQQTVVLSHRNTKSLAAFLSKASDLLHFPVKQVFTTSGEKVNSLKALQHGPSVLVCAGPESFRPPVMEGARKAGTETLSGLTSRNKNGSWGPKAKVSMSRSRSRLGSRPRRFSLLSERDGLSEPLVSLRHPCTGPAPDRLPQDTPAQLGPVVAGDNVEKKVHVNEDGSLSVEMKVCFHLLGKDTLLRPRKVGRAGAFAAASGEGPVLGEVDPFHCVWEGHPGGSSEPGAQGLGTREAACKEVFEQGWWQPGSRYEIWTNPLDTAQGEGMASWRRSRHPWTQASACRKINRKDSDRPVSSDRLLKGSEPNSCSSRSPESSVGSRDLHPAPGTVSQRGSEREADGMPPAGGGSGAEGVGLGSRGHCCLKPRTRGMTGTLFDSSVSATTHKESNERSEQHEGHPRKIRTTTSPRKATHGGGLCFSTMSPLSLRSEGPQAEESKKATEHDQTRDGYGTRLPLASGHLGSGDTAEGCSPPSTCTSATGRRREQESRASAASSPSISDLGRGAQTGCLRQHHGQRDPHCLLNSPESRQMLGPPSTGRVCPAHPEPHYSGSSARARNRASRAPGSPSASLHSQDAQGVSSASITFLSNSDCASKFYPPYSPSPETRGTPEFKAHSLSDSSSSQVEDLGEKAGCDVPKPFQPLLLPVGQHEDGMPVAQRGDCYSQTGISWVCRPPSGEMQAFQASQPWVSHRPCSEACLVCSRFCPTPPKAQPSVKKHPSCNSNGDHSADWGPGGVELGEGQLDVQHPGPPSSQSGATERTVGAVSPSFGSRPGRMFQGQVASKGEGLEEQEDNGSMTLGALPRASPEAVVREWLSNIPEEPVPMKYEMLDDRMDMAGGGLEGSMEVPINKHSPGGLAEPTPARCPSLEGAASEKAELEGDLPVTGDAGLQSGEGLPHSRVSEAREEAGVSEGAAGHSAAGWCVLPHRVSASTQIMKALMGCKQGRPSSLPEVSGPVARRLGQSAQALVTCLSRLHFFDEDLGCPASKVRFTVSPRYQELLSTLQAVWPPCSLGRGELDPGLRELGRCQARLGLSPSAVTEDFTPTSSSGVDVSSGSAGSGEGSRPSAVVSERTELPLKVSCQKAHSRTSENPCGPTASSSAQAWACATRGEEAEQSSGEQTPGSHLDQMVGNVMQEKAEEFRKIQEGKERAELQGEGASGFPEGEGAPGRLELSGAGPQDGDRAQGDDSVREGEAGRDPASAVPCPPGKRERWTGTLGGFTERESNASGSQSGPNAEPGLEKLPRATESGHKPTQANVTQGAGEQGTAVAHRVFLDPDPLWVSNLLTKMEMVFMAHLASAMTELRVHWSLQSSALLDRVVAELQQAVRQRLQDSIEKELLAIQGQAAGKAQGPPRGALRWKTSPQTERRRSCLWGLRNLSAFSEQTWARGTPSLSLEDMPDLSGALGEEFCPCEACTKKKVIPVSPKDTVGRASAPIKEAFDLQQILQKKKGGRAHGETAGTAPEKTEMKMLQRDPLGTGTVQGTDGGLELGLDLGPGVEDGDEDEGSQTLDRGEGPGGEEDATAPRIGENTDSCRGHSPAAVGAQGVGEEENTEAGSGDDISVEHDAFGGAGRSPGEQKDDVDTTEVRETGGEGQSESGRGNQGEKEGRPQADLKQSQLGEASGHNSLDQEGRPTPPSSPGEDTPSQRSGLKTGLSLSRTSSLGNCSQLSQQGSKEDPLNEDVGDFGDESKGVPALEREVTGMYPESPISEQKGPSSGSRIPELGTDGGLTPEPRAGQGFDSGAEKVVKSVSGTEMRFGNFTMDRMDGFGQNDLDF